MSYIVSGDDFKVRLSETNEVTSVLQNVACILRTPRRSAPLYRDFGLPSQFVDRPLPVARTLLIAEIEDAIRVYEPRATVKNISWKEENAESGRLVPVVEVDILAS